MAKQPQPRTYEEAVNWLREHGFDILDAPGTENRVFLKKYNCSAAIERTNEGGVRLFAKPGYLVAGEISRLIDKGYQKFLKPSKAEIPPSADHLKALHQFSEELREALGAISLSTESLRTSRPRYIYDRLEERDLPQPL